MTDESAIYQKGQTVRIIMPMKDFEQFVDYCLKGQCLGSLTATEKVLKFKQQLIHYRIHYRETELT